VFSAHISCPLQSLVRWLSAKEKMNVRDWRLIKKTKKLVDVVPH
jgi:hypothetical protein